MRWGKAWGLATFCVLIFLALTYSVACGTIGFKAFSTFPSSLDQPPLAWWPVTGWVTLAAGGVVIVWAFVACFLIRYLARPALAAISSIVICTALLAAAVAYDRPSGMALYQDRLVYRTIENNFVLRSVSYDAVTRIRVGCGYYKGRGSSRAYPTPIYEAFLADGRRFELDEPVARELPRPVWPYWVALVAPIDERIRAGGVEVEVADLSRGGPSCFSALEQELDSRGRQHWRRLVRSGGETS